MVKCPGCKKSFTCGVGFNNHKRSCKAKIKVAAAERLKLRKDLQAKRLDAEQNIPNQDEVMQDYSPPPSPGPARVPVGFFRTDLYSIYKKLF